MMNKKLWTVVLVFLALIIWQVAMPYYTICQIRQAVENRNVDQLAQYVDFPLLKQNLKTQLQDKLRQNVEQENSGFFGSLALNLTEQTIGKMLDKTVTPQSILLYIQGKQLFDQEYKTIADWTGTDEPKLTSSIEQRKAEVSNDQNWQSHFENFSEFSVIQQRPSGKQIRYVLTRSGLGWKLTNIDLPDFPTAQPE